MDTKLKVLIVDEPGIAYNLAILVDSLGYASFKVSSGVEALQVWKDNPDLALVIMGTDLGTEKGYLIYEKLHQAGYERRVLARLGLQDLGEWGKQGGKIEIQSNRRKIEELEESIERLIKSK